MFDPTIFDNIKVVLEGEIYDLDLDGKIFVVQRKDLIDIAKMSREYRIRFSETMEDIVKTAEINLIADTKDLTLEILEIEDDEDKPGCELIIQFQTSIENPDDECKSIEEKINEIWDYRPTITQTIQYNYPISKGKMYNKISLHFGRKIDEDNISDIPQLIRYTFETLKAL